MNRWSPLLRKVFGAIRTRMDEILLLNPVLQLPESWDQATVRARLQAARERLRPARKLLDAGETTAALVLYRDATRLLLDYLSQLPPHDRGIAPPELDRQVALLSDTEPARLDGTSAESARTAVDELSAMSNFALSLLDRRSRQERRRQRVLRLSGLGLAALAFVALATAWLCRAPNVALGRPATGSAAAFGTSPAGAVDGVRYGWLGFHSGGTGQGWWSVDLGRPFTLDRIEVYGRADCCFDQSVPLALEISRDDHGYRNLATRSEAFSQFDPWRVSGENRVARFIRLRTLHKAYLALGEVEVYGLPTDSDPRRDQLK